MEASVWFETGARRATARWGSTVWCDGSESVIDRHQGEALDSPAAA